MQKSGQYNFIFEILEEVPRVSLNERETYWINFYKTKDYGLNSTRGGS
nr:MAG TPA: intron associated endonuclease [Caudoviricetes sp.]